VKLSVTKLNDLLRIEPSVLSDSRGWFFEAFSQGKLAEAGLDIQVAQANVSHSHGGVLRGLHFQHPQPQGKLVYVLAGSVFDVGVDLRRKSSTFAQWHGEILSADNHRMLYLPPGFAHGFQVLSDSATFCYFCTAPYVASADRSLRWDDPDIAIQWPRAVAALSEKDRLAPSLRELEPQIADFGV
jgi:dTDP-4-dehydrorhamnose 3,5-epimerase